MWLTSVHLGTRVYHLAICSGNFLSLQISPEYGLSCSPYTELAVVLLPLACLALPNFRFLSGIKRRKSPVFVPIAPSLLFSRLFTLTSVQLGLSLCLLLSL